MKKKFTLVLSAAMLIGLTMDFNYQTAISNPDEAPAGNSGAPADGWSTCARIGCHIGGPAIVDQTVTLTGDIPSSGYVSGETYNMLITMSNGGFRYGFSISPQTVQGDLVGTLIASGSGTTLNGGGKYLTQNVLGSIGNGSKTYTFEWTAPDAGSGSVTFYGAFNFANADGEESGDVILSDSFIFNEASVGISEVELATISVYPNPVTDMINIAMKDVDEEIMVTLFGVDGRVAYQQTHTENLIRVDAESMKLNTGIYFLRLEVAGNSTVRKLLVK